MNELPPNAAANNELVSLNSVSQSSKTKLLSLFHQAPSQSWVSNLWGGILPHDALDPTFILLTIFLEEIVRLSLGWRLGVGVVEQVLNAKQDLLHRDGRLPCLFFVEDRETDRARWVDIGVEERGDKFACSDANMLAM